MTLFTPPVESEIGQGVDIHFTIDRALIPHWLGAFTYLMFEGNWSKDVGIGEFDSSQLAKEAYLTVRYSPFPLGTIVPIVTQDVPSWALLCDGATYDRVDYQEYFNVVLDVYKQSADTFITPDLRERGIAGYDPAGFDLGDLGGSPSTTLAIENLPSHNHSQTSYVAGAVTVGAGAPVAVSTATPVSQNTGNRGNGVPFATVSPYHIMRYVVCVR